MIKEGNIPGVRNSGDIFFGHEDSRLSVAVSISLLLHFAILSISFSTSIPQKHQETYLTVHLASQAHLNQSLVPLPPSETMSPTADGVSRDGQRAIESPPSQKKSNVSPTQIDAGDVEIFDSRQLDVRPAIKTRTMPEYPFPISDLKSGVVTLELVIGHTGQVASVSVIKSSTYPEMDRAAITAFMNAAFTPGYIGNRAVNTRIVISVNFDGEN